VPPSIVAVLSHCAFGSLGTVVMLCEWSTGWHCTVAALLLPAHMSRRHLMHRLPHASHAHDDSFVSATGVHVLVTREAGYLV
jgi:hypothetical protein